MTDRTATVGGFAADPGLRMSKADADAAGVSNGDAVIVRGDDRTVTTVRVDSNLATRSVVLGEDTADDAGVRVGDTVTLTAADPKPAREVTLAPVPDLSVRGGESAVRAAAGSRPFVVGDGVTVSLFDGALEIPTRFTAVDPDEVVYLTDRTTIELVPGPADAVAAGHEVPHVPAADVGGYESTRDTLGRALVQPLVRGDDFEAIGSRAGSGLLLTGPSGVGKTHLLRHAASEADATLVRAETGTLLSAPDGELADHLAELATVADSETRAIVHLDALGELGDGSRVRRVADAIDDLLECDRVSVVGEAGGVDDVPAPLRRGDRLARHVDVEPPSREDRRAILQTAIRGLRTEGVQPDAIADEAFGYVAADLGALTQYAVETAVDRTDGQNPVVRQADFETALTETEPSALRGIAVESPDVAFDDVGGLDEAKRELSRSIEWPLRHPDAFRRLGIDAPKGVLLYGPPGTGKTMLARAVAATTNANFLPVNGPELLDKYVGESERAVRELFRRGRANAPAVIFFDEVDALAPARAQGGEGGGASAPERVVSQLLTELDGMVPREGVTVVAATNRPDRLDPALLRPGRLDRLVEVPLPNLDARRRIFEVHARDRPIGDVDFDRLAARTDGYTGSDIAAVVREACLLALESAVDVAGETTVEQVEVTVGPAEFEAALDAVGRSVTDDSLEYYDSVGDRLRGAGDD